MLTQTPRSPSSSGSLASIAAAAKRSTLNVPIRLIRITVSNGSSWWGPRLPAIFSGPADARAADADAQAALALGRRGDGRLDLVRVGHVGLDEPGALAQLGGERGALLLVEVGDRDARASSCSRVAESAPAACHAQRPAGRALGPIAQALEDRDLSD